MSSVGQGVGAVVGGVVGFFTLGGPTGALQGASYGAAIGGALDPADIPGREGPRLSDASEQASGFGVGIPRVYGTIRVAGTVIWIENNRRREVARKTKSSSGKGGGGSQETTTYEYYGTFAVLLADNQVDALKRVWDSRGLLLNTISDDIGTTIESSGLFPLGSLYNPGNEAALKAALQTTPNAGPKGQIRLYPGFDDQEPDPRMEADLGVGNTPAYRGCTLAVFYDFPLQQEYGQSIIGAQLSFELIANSEEGEATLMDTLWGWIPEDADTTIQCPFLSPDKTRIYCSDGDINNQAVISRAISVGPYGQMPADPLDPAAAVSGVVPTAEGMTYEDIGPVFVGTTERSWYRPSFPVNRATLGADGMDRSDIYTQRDGRWLVTSDDTDNLVFAYTEEDGYSTIGPVSQRIWANTIDEHGNMITVSSGSLKIYDGSLTLVKSVDISGQNIDPNTIQPGTKNTLSFRANYDSGIFYMLYMGVEGSIGVHAYNLDLEEELFSTTLSGVTPDPIAESSILFSAERAVRVIDGFVLVFDIYRRSSDLQKYYVLDYWKLPAPSSNGVLLSNVVSSLIEESELIEAADLDVTDLDQTVRGYKTAGPGSIRQRIEPLMLSHSFDLTMSGYQLKAVKRGAASVMTIDPDDLDARPYGSAPGVAFAQSREMDTQLPSVVVVKSLDADRDYEVNQQQSQTMAASRSVNVKEITLPEVFTPDETAGIAEIIWTRSWLERTSFQFSLPQTYRALEATDVVTLPMPYATYSLYLVSVNYTQDNRVECTAVLDDSAIYTTNATGSAGAASSTTIPYDGPSVMHLLDIPAITDTYDDIGFPAALAGYSTTWPGGVIAESNNGGQSYQPIQGYPGSVVSGIVPDALPTADPYVTDTTNTLTVQLYSLSMSISSITKAEMMTGKNWAAYGVAGRWEIIRFADVTVNADDTISLTTMIRGCKGTEQYMSEHDDEDIFVFLSDDDMAFIERASTQIGVSLLYKGVTSGADIDNVSATTFSYTGVNLKPWSAVYPEVTNSGDIVITWKRRSRLESSYWTTGVQIPVGEDTESYEIDIMDGSTVLRTLTATSQTVTYTSAQQTTDSNAADSAIIYQISATVGRGYGTEVAI